MQIILRLTLLLGTHGNLLKLFFFSFEQYFLDFCQRNATIKMVSLYIKNAKFSNLKKKIKFHTFLLFLYYVYF